MKLRLLAPLLLLVMQISSTLSGFAQNAFYDAKKIVRWHRTDGDQSLTADSIFRLLGQYGKEPNDFKNEKENLFVHTVYKKLETALLNDKKLIITPAAIADELEKVNAAAGPNATNKKIPLPVQTLLNRYLYWKHLNEDLPQYQALVLPKEFLQTDTSASSISFSEKAARLNQLLFDTLGIENYEALALKMGEKDSLSWEAAYQQLYEKTKRAFGDSVSNLRRELFDSSIGLDNKAFLLLFGDMMVGKKKLGDSFKELKNANAGTTFKENVEKNKFLLDVNVVQVQPPNVSAPNLVDLNFPSQSDVIDAIAIYLVKRTKQEATLFFLEQMEKAIERDDLAQDLFPETWKAMRELEYHMSPRFGARWRNAISTDFVNLPKSIRNSRFIEQKLGSQRLYKQYFSDALIFADYVGKKFSFLDIVRTLFYDQQQLEGKWTRAGINVLYIINTELRDATVKDRFNWIHPEELLSLDEDEMFCLYDLLKIKYTKGMHLLAPSLFMDKETFARGYRRLQLLYGELLTMLKQFNDIQQKSANKETDGTIVVSDGFWDAQRNLVDFLTDHAADFGLPLKDEHLEALKLCKSAFYMYDYLSNKNFIGAAGQALEVISTLTKKNYKSLIQFSRFDEGEIQGHAPDLVKNIDTINRRFSDLFVLAQIGKDIQGKTFTKQEEWVSFLNGYLFQLAQTKEQLKQATVFNAMAAVSGAHQHQLQAVSHSYPMLKTQLDKLLPAHDRYLFKNALLVTEDQLENVELLLERRNHDFLKWLTDFATLLTEISSAKKSEDLAKVIETYAMPPGSYRLKRSSNFSIDLNAFTGVYIGPEWIEGSNKPGVVYGVTAPVGFAFSWGFPSKDAVKRADDKNNYVNRKGKLRRRSGSSLTVDLTVIDVGAVFSYRINNDSEGLPNEVKWDQVISPALNLRLGLKNTPFVVGMGIQRTPKLRSVKDDVTTDGKSPEPSAAFRLHLSAAFDLPLINIYRSR